MERIERIARITAKIELEMGRQNSSHSEQETYSPKLVKFDPSTN